MNLPKVKFNEIVPSNFFQYFYHDLDEENRQNLRREIIEAEQNIEDVSREDVLAVIERYEKWKQADILDMYDPTTDPKVIRPEQEDILSRQYNTDL